MVSLFSGEEHAREFMKQLRLASDNKDDPLPEWTTPKYIDYETFEATGGTHCICKMKIQHIYLITNKVNKKSLKIGCDCAERWFKAQYSCQDCKSPLGNVKKRMQEQNFICPSCARRKKRELVLARDLLNKQFRTVTKTRPYYPKTLGQLIDEDKFCNYVLNLQPSKDDEEYNLYLKRIQLLVREAWEVGG